MCEVSDVCVICGSYVPEGRMVCPICEEKFIGASAEGKQVKIVAKGKKTCCQCPTKSMINFSKHLKR